MMILLSEVLIVFIWTSRDIGGRACGGVSVLSRDGIPSSECTLNTSLQAKSVTISTSKTITICSLYLPPSENLNIILSTRLIAQLPTPFVICGDLNGHSMTWGCDKNNSRGDRIDYFITDNNVCLLNVSNLFHVSIFLLIIHKLPLQLFSLYFYA